MIVNCLLGFLVNDFNVDLTLISLFCALLLDVLTSQPRLFVHLFDLLSYTVFVCDLFLFKLVLFELSLSFSKFDLVSELLTVVLEIR
jgi:hypothetical protein